MHLMVMSVVKLFDTSEFQNHMNVLQWLTSSGLAKNHRNIHIDHVGLPWTILVQLQLG